MNLGNSVAVETLYKLLNRADYVSLHVPLSEETNNLISTNELAAMKSGSYLLNLSRGNVVNINAVRDSIIQKHLAGAAFDVFPDEPEQKLADWINCLQGLPNVILTPHIGGSTEEAQYHIGQDVAKKINKYINTGSTENCLTFPNIHVGKLLQGFRIVHSHKNIPGAMSKIIQLLESFNINIHNQYLATTDEIGYCIIDANIHNKGDIHNEDHLETIRKTIMAMNITINVRII
jgi:D-3-phosphoglycerate dehydrogenase